MSNDTFLCSCLLFSAIPIALIMSEILLLIG